MVGDIPQSAELPRRGSGARLGDEEVEAGTVQLLALQDLVEIIAGDAEGAAAPLVDLRDARPRRAVIVEEMEGEFHVSGAVDVRLSSYS